DEGEPALRRRAVRVAGEHLPPREPLHHVVVAAFGRPRPGHAVAGERAADDAWVDVPQLRAGQPEPLRLVTAEVGEHCVAGAHDVLEHRSRIRMAEVEGDAALAAVERLEEEGVLALLERGHVAADVAATGWILDLDHVRTEVGELQRRPRAGPELLDGDD